MTPMTAYLFAINVASFGLAMWRHEPFTASVTGMIVAFMLFHHVEAKPKPPPLSPLKEVDKP